MLQLEPPSEDSPEKTGKIRLLEMTLRKIYRQNSYCSQWLFSTCFLRAPSSNPTDTRMIYLEVSSDCVTTHTYNPITAPHNASTPFKSIGPRFFLFQVLFTTLRLIYLKKTHKDFKSGPTRLLTIKGEQWAVH